MRIIVRRTLREFWEKHRDAEEALRGWFKEVSKAKWENFNELKQDFPSASILRNNRVVFDIKGNKYRLIARINFPYKIIWIRFIGTHAEYDKIDASNI